MTQFHEHHAKQGERFDLIAFNYYGNPLAYLKILQANPQYYGKPVLNAGDRVLVPKKSVKELRSSAANLPPWKR